MIPLLLLLSISGATAVWTLLHSTPMSAWFFRTSHALVFTAGLLTAVLADQTLSSHQIPRENAEFLTLGSGAGLAVIALAGFLAWAANQQAIGQILNTVLGGAAALAFCFQAIVSVNSHQEFLLWVVDCFTAAALIGVAINATLLAADLTRTESLTKEVTPFIQPPALLKLIVYLCSAAVVRIAVVGWLIAQQLPNAELLLSSIQLFCLFMVLGIGASFLMKTPLSSLMSSSSRRLPVLATTLILVVTAEIIARWNFPTASNLLGL